MLEGFDTDAESVCTPGSAARTTSIRESPNEIRVRASVDGGGWLMLADTAYPGWRATVDGQRAKLWTANGLFRAVRLPAGEHRVAFTYRPFSFYAGLALSTISWFAFALVWWKARPEHERS